MYLDDKQLDSGALGRRILADPLVSSELAGKAATVDTDPVSYAVANLSAKQSTLPRLDASGVASLATGVLRIAYYTAPRTETITSVRTVSIGAAGATPTLCRVGIYTIDGSGNLTLVASIASDTTMWAGTFTGYTRSLSSPYGVTKGTRYAVGVLCVTGATAPTIFGFSNSGALPFLLDSEPRLAAAIGSQTDLPASVTAASLANASSMPYVELIP